jgi:hypothetical protein
MWMPTAVGSDPAVQLHVDVWRRRKWVQPIVVCLVLAMLMFLLHRGFSMLGVFFLALVAVQVVGLVQFRSRVGWWLPSAGLLDGAQAVRAAAQVVGGARAWMLLSINGQYLKVTNAEAPVRQLAARLGEVSLIGPDAHGVGAVLLDGLPAPLPAKVVPAPVNPQLVAVTDQDLPRWGASRAARMVWIGLGTVALGGASVAFDVVQLLEHRTIEAWGGFALVLAVAIVAAFFRQGDQHRMVKLLGNGPWQAYPVQLMSWGGNPAAVGQMRLVLTLPDGRQLPVSARLAPAWLIANITATGTLWVAGAPQFGRSAVVGLPGHPLVAPVKFRELQAR